MEGDDFAGSFYSNLRSLVTLVDHLRDAGLQKYIRLPRIVTLGVQSSGKSSVLESIVGLNFLPRNEGVCTRRPLELRLVNITENTKPYAVFESVDGKFTDFNKVRDMIIKLTEDKAGKTKNIIDDPIILTIYSNTCPDLTLIDLPGITRIPVGDQPKNIYEITKEMCHRYISDPRTIILCVCAANVDMTTSDGLLMAQRVDKAGIRTLGVITKIDIMDRGTSAKNVLLGKEVPLKLGFVGVKNRSQEDINNEMRVENALRDEREFFARHEIYSTMPPGYLGTEVLTQKLTKVLFTHIKSFLPDIIRETMLRVKDCEDRLRELGPSAPVDMRSKLQLLWNMVTDFIELFKNTIRGKYDRRANTRITRDLVGGATIKLSFNSLLQDYSDNYQATRDFTDEDIQKAIAMHEGDSMPGFPSVDVFIYLMQSQLEKLRGPVIDCLIEIHAYLEGLAHSIIKKLFYRFPTLISEICNITSYVLAKERDNTREIVESIITSEEGYIFTNDLEYLTQRTDIIPKADPKAPARVVNPEILFVQEIRNRIDSYFRLVVRSVRDTVPKIIGYFLVRTIMDKLQLELYDQINRSEVIINQLSEPANIAAEREQIKKQLETLRKAEKLLKHNPEFSRQTEDISKEIEEQEEAFKRDQEAKKGGKHARDEPDLPVERQPEQPKVDVKAAQPKNEPAPKGANMFGLDKKNEPAKEPAKGNFFNKN